MKIRLMPGIALTTTLYIRDTCNKYLVLLLDELFKCLVFRSEVLDISY